MKKYKYKIIAADYKGMFKTTLDLSATEAVLTGEGLDGWELINTFNVHDGDGTIKIHSIMKKEAG